MVCAGQCRYKISVQTVATTRTDEGGFTEAYTHSFYTTGNVLGLTGKEYFEAAQTQGSTTYKITVRNNSNTRGMTTEDRMVATARGVTKTFNILSKASDARCRDFIIMAVESVTDSVDDLSVYQTSDGENYQTADGEDYFVLE